jgi:thiol-disulfide isomerase/thioredoxin
MSKHFLFLTSLISIFTLISKISFTNSVEIKEITDYSIDSIIGDGIGKKNMLLMFYLDNCPHCKSAMKNLEKLSLCNEISSDVTLRDIKIGKIECSKNNWSCLRFNITRVPTFVQLKHDKLFEYKDYVSFESLLRFVSEEKLVSEGKPIPEQMGMITIATRILRESVGVMNEQISDFLNNTLKLKIKWIPTYTIILLSFLLVTIIAVEYYIIQKCFGSQKVNLKKIENKNNENSKEKNGEDQQKDEKKDEVESGKEKRE